MTITAFPPVLDRRPVFVPLSVTPRAPRTTVRTRLGRVVVLSATVGQGHEGAARELARRLGRRDVDVEVHDYLDALPSVVRHGLRDLYQPMVQYGPRLFDRMFQGLEHDGLLRRTSDAVCAAAEDAVERWCRGTDVVVATYPLAGQTLGRLREQGRLAATPVTYLTDPAAHATWCHPAVPVHLTVTRATALDARRYGVSATAAGPLCTPGFGHARRSRARLRRELGLPVDAPVVLLSAGSLGMGAVPRTVSHVLAHPDAHVVVLCGRSDGLRRGLARRSRVTALGWRDDVPDVMGAADVLIHNAGGLSFTEALVSGLPAITYLPIPGHGRANAGVLEAAGVAAWPRDPGQLRAAIDDALARGPVRRAWPRGADPAAVVADLLAHRGPVTSLSPAAA